MPPNPEAVAPDYVALTARVLRARGVIARQRAVRALEEALRRDAIAAGRCPECGYKRRVRRLAGAALV